MKEYGRLIRSRPTIQHSGVTCLNYTYFNSKNICNLIPINKISLFTASTTWHCCRLHYCLGTFFWNYLYSNQQVWTSTFFLIFSYLVSSLLIHSLEQTDRQTDVPTYQTGQTIVWKLKKTFIKILLVAILFWVSYFCFLQGVSIILLLLGFYFVRIESSSTDRTEQEKHERKKKYWLWFV